MEFKVVLGLALILLASFSSAAVIDETGFADLGQIDFELNEPNTKKCFETRFSPTVDLNQEVYGIVSVHTEFLPKAGKKSHVRVLLNEKVVNELNSTEFVDGWGRFNVPQGKIREENLLKICLTTSFEVSKIRVLNDSMIGYYLKPDFEKKGAFQIIVSPNEPRLLEEFTVTGVLKNFGSEPAEVLLKYRKDYLEKETPETELVKGETEITRTAPACQKRDASSECVEPGVIGFEYLLRPKLLGPITLLPSIAEFENPFGERVTLESNRPTIRIVEPEIKIKPFIQIEKEQFLVGEKADAVLFITNEGQNPLFNLSLTLKTGGADILKGSKSEVIEIIRENETISREFTLSSIEARQFEVGCSIDYLDYNVVKSFCNDVTIEFRDPALDITVIGAALLLVLSVAIYIYIHLKK